MTLEQVKSSADREMKSAKSFYLKLKKFEKGEIHPTMAAHYNRERLIILNRLNNIEDFAKKQFHTKISGLHNAKELMWSSLASLKYRMSDL